MKIKSAQMRDMVIFMLFLAGFLISIGLPAKCGNNDPLSPPALPAKPPPLCGTLPLTAPPEDPDAPRPSSEKVTLTCSLPAGWSIVSFPLARLQSVSGLSRVLYHYTGNSFYPLDPVQSPSHVSTRWAYLAYADRPETLSITGFTNAQHIRSLPLAGGWNLIGCPSRRPLPLGQMTASMGNTTRPFNEITAADEKDSSWLSSKGFALDGSLSARDLLSPEAALVPEKGLWIFAWHPIKLVFMSRKPAAEGPAIIGITPMAAITGDVLIIDGRGFSSAPGLMTIGGAPVEDQYILTWSDNRIQFRLPPYVMSGNLTLFVNRKPSNSFSISISDSPDLTLLSTLIGKIQSPLKQALSGALVTLDNGLWGQSTDDGSFKITKVPPGTHSLRVSKLGYNEARGEVHLKPGRSDAVLITLSSPEEPLDLPPANSETGAGSGRSSPQNPAAPKKGMLHVVADAYDDGYHRWWVCKIDVSEWGNSNYHWYNDWYSDLGDAWYELSCDGARVGKTFVIDVYWASKDGGTRLHNSWYRTLYSTHQTETIDSPETLVH
jgi:hypothetical protein